ncbi:DUF6461 domain-containing protein [Amycolatopsis sp. NPDC049253]|uniref:DUF6461 domain-containing protein n=1 Tax=Amycolatopsis sp. NPDC049253 TaxID=3155274 RepID=UPI00341C71E0
MTRYDPGVPDGGNDPFGWTQDPSVVMVCTTFVERLSPTPIFEVLHAEQPNSRMSSTQLAIAVGDDREGIRVADIGSWALVIELESLVAVRDEILARHSRSRRRVVQVYRTGSGMESFGYWRDGESQCRFEPTNPARRTGRDPDVLVGEMRASGIDPASAEMLPGYEMYTLAAEVIGVIADTGVVVEAELEAGLVARRRRRVS